MAESARVRKYYRSRKAYNKYKQLYMKKKAVLERKGYEMADDLYTFTQYKENILEMRNTLKIRVAKGRIKRIGSVNAALVNDQAYELSEEQAYSIFDFLKQNREKYDIDVSFIKNINSALMKIRQGEWLNSDVGLWDMIKDYRRDAYAKYKELEEKDPDALAELYAELDRKNPDTKVPHTIAELVREDVSSTFYGSP